MDDGLESDFVVSFFAFGRLFDLLDNFGSPSSPLVSHVDPTHSSLSRIDRFLSLSR